MNQNKTGYDCRNLSKITVEELHPVFLNMFSDYAVPMSLSMTEYHKMLKRRGFVPNISVGVYHTERNELVGFVLNGLKTEKNQRIAYDIMTGVIPSERNKGLSSLLFEATECLLLHESVNTYVLEVMKVNESALHVYQKQGFSISREYQVYGKDIMLHAAKATTWQTREKESFSDEDWGISLSFWTTPPSWQNHIEAVKMIETELNLVIVEHNHQMIGYGMIDKSTGDIPQIAVSPSFRRQGVGRTLIDRLIELSEKDTVKLVNVDATDQELNDFLLANGFTLSLGQYEMKRNLK